MMRRLMPLGIALLVFGAAVAMSATVTEAQVSPEPITVSSCDITRYDLSGDGTLGKIDILTWLDRVEASSSCPLGGSGVGDCAEYDMDGDGTITLNDARTMYIHFLACVQGAIVAPR